MGKIQAAKGFYPACRRSLGPMWPWCGGAAWTMVHSASPVAPGHAAGLEQCRRWTGFPAAVASLGSWLPPLLSGHPSSSILHPLLGMGPVWAGPAARPWDGATGGQVLGPGLCVMVLWPCWGSENMWLRPVVEPVLGSGQMSASSVGSCVQGANHCCAPGPGSSPTLFLPQDLGPTCLSCS